MSQAPENWTLQLAKMTSIIGLLGRKYPQFAKKRSAFDMFNYMRGFDKGISMGSVVYQLSWYVYCEAIHDRSVTLVLEGIAEGKCGEDVFAFLMREGLWRSLDNLQLGRNISIYYSNYEQSCRSLNVPAGSADKTALTKAVEYVMRLTKGKVSPGVVLLMLKDRIVHGPLPMPDPFEEEAKWLETVQL